MRTLALYCVLFGGLTALLILFATTGGPSFVESRYRKYHPEVPAGPPKAHSESHGGKTQQQWHYNYRRDARNYGLNEDQCLAAFPELYKEVDRAVAWRKERGDVQLEDLDVGWRGDGIVRAMIYDNQLYIIDAHGVWDQNHRPRAMATLHSLHRAITAYQGVLPNVEFTMTDHDSALINMRDNHTTWSFSRLEYQQSLWLMPDFGFWGWPDVGLRSYAELQRTVESDEDDFLDKIPKIVWRGATAGLGSQDVRTGLLKASEGQEWSDVQALNWHNKTNIDERLLGMEDHCNYMFLAQTEGNTYSGRLKALLNCHSVLVSHKLKWIEHFHHLLIPSGKAQNYIPVKRDFSDLPKKMRHLLQPSNILYAQQIADNARSTFRECYLTPAAEACYWRALLRGWSEVQGFDVKPWVETEVPDYVAGKTRVKRKMRGAPFESFVIMEEVDWEIPSKPRRMCILD
jgi:hypothetical protein